MQPAIAVLGTASDVGKTAIVVALGRILRSRGFRVAPFKAQNMSNNAYVTRDGLEMSHAQAFQAQACGVEPSVHMNPILLKPESDVRCQVILHGTSIGHREAADYFGNTKTLWPSVLESLDILRQQVDLVVIEGAGSAAEVNLRDRDIVNWPVVEHTDAAVVLVADIDRGGVFAQVIGTLDLLSPADRRHVRGIIINKFRGDPALFADGVRFIEQKTGLPILGVIPYLQNAELPAEDGLPDRAQAATASKDGQLRVAVALLPHMSNVADFQTLAAEPDVVLSYARTPADIVDADVVILPGTKSTLADLNSLRERGFPAALDACRDTTEIVGICGGYQMLGAHIADPEGVEGGGSAAGLGYLDVDTVLSPKKATQQVQGFSTFLGQERVAGYEIHAGRSRRGHGTACFELSLAGGRDGEGSWLDGTRNVSGNIWGTYVHGIFDAPGFRRAWLNRLRERKGWQPMSEDVSIATQERLDGAIERWAAHVAEHLDVSALWSS